MMEILNEIQKIEKTLADRKINKRHLFYHADITHQTWSNWRSGKHTPTFTTWNKVEAAFNRLRYEAHASDE